MAKKYDFGGYATRNDLLCSDGRTIRKDAFKKCDGKTVPIVFQHCHTDPTNIVGNALLENREDGVYCYGSLNNTEKGLVSKELIEHGDITALSIYANGLQQSGGNVLHGDIKEVSLVLAGANPGAYIDSLNLVHGDETSDDEAIIYTGEEFEESIAHADEANPKEGKEMAKEKTVEDMLNDLDDEHRKFVVSLVGKAYEDGKASVAHSDMEDGDDGEDADIEDGEEVVLVDEDGNIVDEDGNVIEDDDEEEITHSEEDYEMKTNVFAQDGMEQGEVLTHADVVAIFDEAKKTGSLKDAVLAHADYGVEPIDYLFPNAKTETATPDFIKRDTTWVGAVMSGVHHTPFSRIKTIHADITEDEARARGYMKGNRKKEEVFTLLKRETTPTTVYKKQKLDRDDIIDITDFDIVAWIKSEMRGMLDEEIARAILVGDGRSTASDDKINEMNVRPIWTDDQLYTINVQVATTSTTSDTDKAKAFIKAAIKARKHYKGSGRPVLFTTEDLLTDMLLIEDGIGHDLYDSEEKLATKLRVSKIVTVEVMENLTRVVGGVTRDLAGIIVNLNDYSVGADKGGAVNMFDDFDIDFNQYKYLIETRCSGALRKPYSAIVIEFAKNTSLTVEPDASTATRLGKSVADLQTGVYLDAAAIKGKLNYITGYTGFSQDTEKQKGNYLALAVEAPEGAVKTVELIGGNRGPVTMDDDWVVLRITSKHQKVKVTAADENGTVTKVYDLSGVELEPAN